MGADLIGFIVKGPTRIKKDKQKKAVQYLTQLFDAYIEQAKKDPSKDPDINYLRKYIPKQAADMMDIDEEQFIVILQENARIDPKVLVKTMVDFWHAPNYRDVCVVIDPDDIKQHIMFAGDMSWGDEPEGPGYRELKRIYWLGVDKILGLKF